VNSNLAKIREHIGKINGFLATDINNIRYLTVFTGSSGYVLITKTKNIFITDFRYKEQANAELSGWEIVIAKGKIINVISGLSKKLGIKSLGFETTISYDFFRELSKKRYLLKPFKNLIEKFRAIKDVNEIKLIREAIRRAEAAFLNVLPYIKAGTKETRIAGFLEQSLKKEGCKRSPFDIIVASGKNSSMPHARPSEKRLQTGDLVVVDWGGEAGGYFSDMTRTVAIKGSGLAKKKEIYKIVLDANKAAVKSIEPGIDARKIDNSARDVIKKAGYSDYFGHGTGHGVGLQVHELPHVSWAKKEIIKKNMVFTIEPGIYIPDLGGIRIEDMVVCRNKGVLLTNLSRDLKII
jgi:Xaa-Pro aminopeptidase